jgi:hypothetical protein
MLQHFSRRARRKFGFGYRDGLFIADTDVVSGLLEM